MTISVNYTMILIVVVAFSVVALLVTWALLHQKKIERKYGSPVIPDDIRDMVEDFEIKTFQINISDFRKIDGTGKWSLYMRTYKQIDGVWTLNIEYKKDELVAVEARFKSAYSMWLNRGFIRTKGITRYINNGSS